MKSFTIETLNPKLGPREKVYISAPILVSTSLVSIANGLYDTLTDLIVIANKPFDLHVGVLAKSMTGSKTHFREPEHFLGMARDITSMFAWNGMLIYENHNLHIPILSRSDDNKVYCYIVSVSSVPDQITLKIGVERA